MSRSFSFPGTLLVAALAFSWSAVEATAADIVLKDGSVIQASRPYQTKGTTALITLKDGTLVSVPLSRIDVQKTEELAARPKQAPPQPVAVATPPLTPAEAARQKRRKATVVLTDEQVSHPVGGLEEEGASTDSGGRVEVTGVNTTRGPNGFTITGSVVNVGTSEAFGITVAVEAIGAENKTLATSFANVAKTRLGPGESAAINAEVAGSGIVNFRFVPRWQVPVAVPPASSEAGTAAPNPSPSPAPVAPAAAPAAPAQPPPQPTILPRGDLAAPPANAPMGSSAPGASSGYIPSTTSSGQPKPIK